MKARILDFVVCPICRGDLTCEAVVRDSEEVRSGTVSCGSGHRFPIVDGVPRLLPDAVVASDDARSIQESFSREWAHFDYERDRAWGHSSEYRRDVFLQQLDIEPQELQGRVVLDAGCGVGVLSTAVAGLGCEVVAGDIGHQVIDAHRHYAREGVDNTYFLQADLMNPPFRRESVDFIYSGGVLHHTPSTKATFDLLVPALAPGGRIFIWLYHNVPGLPYALRMRARKEIAALPGPVKHAVVLGLLPQSLLRQRLRIATGRQSAETHLNAHEKLITMLDSFTCRYRWEHTPEEVAAWYREHGMIDIKTTDVGKWGFGVVATRPAVPQTEPVPNFRLQRA